MTRRQSSKRKRAPIAVAGALLLIASTVFFLDFNNGLALEQPPEGMQIGDTAWVKDKRVLFNLRAGDESAPVEGLPTDDHVYFTNTHFADGYQYAQTAGENSWTQSQRLFWRKDSTEDWKEIQLTEEAVSPSYFVSKNGRQYLAATGGSFDEDNYLYLIDVEKGTFERQLKAGYIVISPDATKILCDDSGRSSFSGAHRLSVLDLRDGTNTAITSLTEISPGSGRSFGFEWPNDSRLLRIKGVSKEKPDGFRYIYDHNTKRLFDT